MGEEEAGPVRKKSTQGSKPMSMAQEGFNDILDKEQAAEDVFNLERNLPNLSEVDETIVQEEELDDEVLPPSLSGS